MNTGHLASSSVHAEHDLYTEENPDRKYQVLGVGIPQSGRHGKEEPLEDPSVLQKTGSMFRKKGKFKRNKNELK